jgi:hypothetical protein
MSVKFCHRALWALIAAATIILFTNPGSGQAEVGLVGKVFIAGSAPNDSPAGEPEGTHAYVTLKGDGAVLIYQSMQNVESDDLCRGDGWKMKRSGPFGCSFHADTGAAVCDYSIDLMQGALADGLPC